MSVGKKVAAGVLLGLGSLSLIFSAIFIIPAIIWTSPNASKNDREAGLGFLILGTPFALIGATSVTTGGWLLWVANRRSQEMARDRIQETFFRLVREGNGHITVFRFAMETQLPGEVAKQFLDEKAQEFVANFDVDEQGGISYYFNVGSLPEPSSASPPLPPPPSPNLESAFEVITEGDSVILEDVPASCKIEAIKIVREITGLGLKEAKDLVEAVPAVVKRGVSRTSAEDIQRRFEAVGARVTLR